MSIQTVTAAVGWYPQSGLGFRPPDTQPFYWHPAQRASLAPVQLQRPFAREIGGTLLPFGAYKGGVYAAGQLNLLPRVCDALAFMFLGFAGSVTSTGGGPYTHIFGRQDTTIPSKYMAFRRMTPTTSGFYGETMWDGRVTGLTLGAQAGQLVNLQANVQAIVPVANPAPAGAGWAPNSDQGGYDTYLKVPMASNSLISMPDGSPITTFRNLQVAMTLGTPQPEAEMVLGSYYPHDITPLYRDITISGQIFWRNPTLYSNMFYGGGSAWSPTVWQGGQPFVAQFETANKVLAFGTSTALLNFTAQSVVWMAQPVDLVGGDIVVLDLVGTVVHASSYEDWRLVLRTDTPSYTWPT